MFFWGHSPSRDGNITKSCLSQWWEDTPFHKDDQEYLTAEHWMMVEKAKLFGHGSLIPEILMAENPGKAKAYGRRVEGFDQDIWNDKKFDIVVEGNYLKFSQNADLARFLVSTGERVLVEASPIDPIWGIGLTADDARAEDPQLWQGHNLLGFALMEVRDRLVVEA